MKLIFSLLFLFFPFTRIYAQYYGGTGRGDVVFLEAENSLSGEVIVDISIVYRGGLGRGDVVSLKSENSLSGGNIENVSIVYHGGTGRGDIFLRIRSGLADCAITSYWNGSVSDAWEHPANWNCNQVPGINSNVVIPTNVSHYPLVISSTEIKSLELRTGSSITIRPGVILKVNKQ